VHVAAADPESVRDVCRARRVLEVAGVRHWPEASEELRDEVRRALTGYTAAVRDGASYQRLNEKHLAIHRSLVGLLDSPRLVATAEALSAELRLALAQIDRIRRNAHDQAGSHNALLHLLERGDIDGGVAEIEHHLADAEVAILDALGAHSAG